ncbi:glucose-6-phosphate isomerase [Klugiella xanthotipulae]|uniref:Glucose-6-phosphate isomerase n=1 Tax=Klugiella xanthotipulae TaxID=244735 RepID=A0A543HSP0_9MICO|nr:glucose-6-phosphate isomerase [Klugiella xanthotipulae]TQM61355.1 glucose-6-phosphate isomerase [Klugiella xanthotipulae]
MSAFVAVGSALREQIAGCLTDLVQDHVASRLSGSDHTLWGREAEAEAVKRLGWLASTKVSAPLVEQILALREEFISEGITHIVLGGMGGSSLAPEVITATAGVGLTVLDSTDPDQVREAIGDRLAHTAVVISSKSGSTLETDSQRRAYEAAFTAAGIKPADRIVVVTDPASPLHESASAAGYRVFLADPAVGGRYSALTAFGLVPSGLAGVDIATLLNDADAVMGELASDSTDNPGLVLAAALAARAPGVDKVGLVADDSPIIGFGDWAEQLIAESTGKGGTGILPVVLSAASYEARTPSTDILLARLVNATSIPRPDEIQVTGPLGAQFMLWEFATAVAGRILGINPFDQPDVESAKVAARGLLDSTPEVAPPVFIDNGVEVRGNSDIFVGETTLTGAISKLFDRLSDRGYASIQAYTSRNTHPELAALREDVAEMTGRPTTFGWGPRFLHSTGQYHKGGAPVGVFLQIRTVPTEDLSIPDRPFTFGQLISAQAEGDASVLMEQGRPVLIVTLHNAAQGAQALREAIAAARLVR